MENALKQKQKIVHMAQLRNSLSVLSYNAIELHDFIKRETECNPALEIPEVHTPSEIELEKYVSLKSDFRDDFFAQLRMTASLSQRELFVCSILIESVNENGYLDREICDDMLSFSIGDDEFEKALSIVQGFDPPGVFARDLAECLILQLMREECVDECAVTLIRNHLNEIAEGNLNVSGYTNEEILNAVDHIRLLNPIPCHESQDNIRYIVPDVEIKVLDDGQVNVRLINQVVIPTVSQDIGDYRKQTDNEGRAFISTCLKRARWLRYAVAERNNMLMRICSEIASIQHDYFVSGLPLVSLTMNTIANCIGCNKSTVSRAVAGKYILFNNKVIGISSFFDSSTSSGHSRDCVKRRIASIVFNSQKGISDQYIVDILAQEGITVGRSTVNKYRREIDDAHRMHKS